MGFYVRKPIAVGPLRFNLSKSGIGVSAGVRGARFGVGPRGNYVHLGRGGLYYRQTLIDRPPQPQPANRVDHIGHRETVGPMEEVESATVLAMVDTSATELLKELNDKRRQIGLVPYALAFSLLFLFLLLGAGAPGLVLLVSLLLAFVVCLAARARDVTSKTTVILYELAPDVEAAYQRLHDSFDELLASARTWHIEARANVRDRKYHAGADSLVRRKVTHLRKGSPSLVATNVEVPLIPVGRQTLAFMPDRLLVFQSRAVGAVPYSQLNVTRNETNFIDEDVVPKDATVVDRTWRYVNKRGGPDRRFKDNREIPVCRYEQLHFSSTSGLNEKIQLSRLGAGVRFEQALSTMATLPVGVPTDVPQPS